MPLAKHVALFACACALLLSGCAHAQAKAAATPPLDVPQPPPRVIEATTAEVPQPVGLIADPAPAPARPRAAAPATPPRQEPPRPEIAKPEPPPAAEVVKPVEEPRQPLQTTPTQQELEMETRIRVLLTRATNDLNRIDYRGLGSNARTQYETAKGFIKQAEDALREKNLPFASSLADKASGLAAQLAGR